MSNSDTLFSLLERGAERHPQNVYLATARDTRTYRETYDAALRQAAVLAAQGIKPGDAVAIYAGRSFDMVASLYALLLLGANVIPLDMNEPQDRIANLLDRIEARWVVTDADALPTRLEARQLSLRPASGDFAAFDLAQRPHVAPQSTALTFFTTGSTGQPKGIELSHTALLSGQTWLQSAIPLDPTDRQMFRTTIGVTNLFRELFWPALSGASCFLLDDGQHADISAHVDAVASHGVTVIGAVPILIDTMVATASRSGDLSGLRHVICTSDVFLTEHLKRFREAMPGARIYNVFGLTEAPYIAWQACDDLRLLDRQVPIGSAADLSSVVLGEDLKPVPTNMIGRLYVAGDGMLARYWADPALTAARCIDIDGVRHFDTGDMAFKDDNGVLHLSGRSEYLVKVGGQRVDIFDVEQALAEIDGVHDVCVLPYEMGGGVRRLAAWIGAKPGTMVEEKQVRRLLAGSLKSYMIPTEIRFVDALPRTHNGKVDKKKLELSLRQSAAFDDADGTEKTADQKLSDIICAVLNITGFELDDSIISLGGDSISAFLISVRANEIGIQIEPTTMLSGTIGDAFNAPRRAVGAGFAKSADVQRNVHSLDSYGWSETEINALFARLKEDV